MGKAGTINFPADVLWSSLSLLILGMEWNAHHTLSNLGGYYITCASRVTV